VALTGKSITRRWSIKANGTGPSVFWNFGDGTLQLDISNYTDGGTPNATAAFKAAFGTSNWPSPTPTETSAPSPMQTGTPPPSTAQTGHRLLRRLSLSADGPAPLGEVARAL
jgi:hypothetical protein